MTDRFEKQHVELNSPAADGFSIGPNTANIFSQPTREIYVGVNGNVEVIMSGYSRSDTPNANTKLMFRNVPTGTTLKIRAKSVTANTSASGLIGLY